jgi:hypothetical protein
MLVALAVAARSGRTDGVRLLSAILVAGILGEVDTWTTLHRPRSDLLGVACVVLDVFLPAALIAETLRSAPVSESDPRPPSPLVRPFD